MVASVFARISPSDHTGNQLTREAVRYRDAMQKDAPGVWEAVFDYSRQRTTWMRESNGLFAKKVVIQADSPLLASYLVVFSAKLGMALYRHHIGSALDLDGVVQVEFFLNAGLTQAAANAYLSILPSHETLKQGAFNVSDQFSYRYNTDGKTIIAGMASFHGNLHVFFIATSKPEVYLAAMNASGRGEFIRPGDLLKRLSRADEGRFGAEVS